MAANLLDFPLLGGLTVGIVISVNALIARYLLMYHRETREEYARRLTRAVIELEVQKTRNVKLECQIELLKCRGDEATDSTIPPDGVLPE